MAKAVGRNAVKGSAISASIDKFLCDTVVPDDISTAWSGLLGKASDATRSHYHALFGSEDPKRIVAILPSLLLLISAKVAARDNGAGWYSHDALNNPRDLVYCCGATDGTVLVKLKPALVWLASLRIRLISDADAPEPYSTEEWSKVATGEMTHGAFTDAAPDDEEHPNYMSVRQLVDYAVVRTKLLSTSAVRGFYKKVALPLVEGDISLVDHITQKELFCAALTSRYIRIVTAYAHGNMANSHQAYENRKCHFLETSVSLKASNYIALVGPGQKASVVVVSNDSRHNIPVAVSAESAWAIVKRYRGDATGSDVAGLEDLTKDDAPPSSATSSPRNGTTKSKPSASKQTKPPTDSLPVAPRLNFLEHLKARQSQQAQLLTVASQAASASKKKPGARGKKSSDPEKDENIAGDAIDDGGDSTEAVEDKNELRDLLKTNKNLDEYESDDMDSKDDLAEHVPRKHKKPKKDLKEHRLKEQAPVRLDARGKLVIGDKAPGEPTAEELEETARRRSTHENLSLSHDFEEYVESSSSEDEEASESYSEDDDGGRSHRRHKRKHRTQYSADDEDEDAPPSKRTKKEEQRPTILFSKRFATHHTTLVMALAIPLRAGILPEPVKAAQFRSDWENLNQMALCRKYFDFPSNLDADPSKLVTNSLIKFVGTLFTELPKKFDTTDITTSQAVYCIGIETEAAEFFIDYVLRQVAKIPIEAREKMLKDPAVNEWLTRPEETNPKHYALRFKEQLTGTTLEGGICMLNLAALLFAEADQAL